MAAIMRVKIAIPSGVSVYEHPVQGDREVDATIAGWTKNGGFWRTDGRLRIWVPWHTVSSVELPINPGVAMAGGPLRKPKPPQPPGQT
jgi:hypothetical protein